MATRSDPALSPDLKLYVPVRVPQVRDGIPAVRVDIVPEEDLSMVQIALQRLDSKRNQRVLVRPATDLGWSVYPQGGSVRIYLDPNWAHGVCVLTLRVERASRKGVLRREIWLELP